MSDNKNKDCGIVICAVGHPYYGRLAYNLCLSIKAVENFPVTVICSEHSLNHLSASQKAIVDQIIVVPDIEENCHAKLYSYTYSPYKKTLLLDADMLWLPSNKPSVAIKTLEGISFTAITEGHDDDPAGHYFFWADPKEIRAVYNVDRVYQWRSEVMYFEKGSKIRKLFADAIRVCANPKVKMNKFYAGIVPDELAVNISAAINDIHPHEYKWQPSYWYMLYGTYMPSVPGISSKFWLVSFGGNITIGNAKTFYDKLMKATCYKMGVQHVFPLHSKHDFLPERAKV